MLKPIKQLPIQPTNKKLQQFIEELNALSVRYQYQLKVILNYTPDGIFPKLTIADVPPKKIEPKTKEKKNG